MKPNKYTPFEYKNEQKGKYRGKFGLKNNSSPFKKQNKLKYIFGSKEEAERFAAFLLNSEKERFSLKKRPCGGKYNAEVRPEKIFLMLEFA